MQGLRELTYRSERLFHARDVRFRAPVRGAYDGELFPAKSERPVDSVFHHRQCLKRLERGPPERARGRVSERCSRSVVGVPHSGADAVP